MIMPQLQGVLHAVDKGRSLFAASSAGEHETGTAALDRVVQATDTVHDAGLAGPHREHLADSARLEARWHQEQVAALIKQAAELLRIASQENKVGVIRGDGRKPPLVVALAAAEHYENALAPEPVEYVFQCAAPVRQRLEE